jgi:hypothetical protein
MKDTRTPRDDEQRRGRASDDDTRKDTWYDDCKRQPVDEPLIATIPLPDGQ